MQVKDPGFAIIPIFDLVLFKAICGMRDIHLHNSLQHNDTFSMVKRGGEGGGGGWSLRGLLY